jgi:hypothetical protein
MISWDEYYNSEMERIEKSKIRLEKAFFYILCVYLITQIVLCAIGASLW